MKQYNKSRTLTEYLIHVKDNKHQSPGTPQEEKIAYQLKLIHFDTKLRYTVLTELGKQYLSSNVFK